MWDLNPSIVAQNAPHQQLDDDDDDIKEEEAQLALRRPQHTRRRPRYGTKNYYFKD